MSGFPATFALSSLNGTNGFRIDGAAGFDFSGISVSGAGDVNGDGFADIIIGAYRAGPGLIESGASYVVFGKASGFPAGLDLSSLNGGNGFRLTGEAAFDNNGLSVSSAGDVNGDGYDDIIVGSPFANANGSSSGASYVVFGRASGFAASRVLSSLNGNNGFKISGAAGEDFSGRSVSAAGDINGDGFGDIIIGAFGADPNGSFSGATYVVFGRASGFAPNLELSALDGANGFRISGAAAEDRSGRSVASAGDVNGDGFDDLIIGAMNADANGINSGASYVVFGKASGFDANLDLAALNGANGFRIIGTGSYERSGFAVSSVGDVNGDGFADIIIGSYGPDAFGFSAGTSHVVFGKAGGFAADLNLASLDGSNGFRLTGAAPGDGSGRSVSSAGDVNGDGFDDLIIGAYNADPNGYSSGASYVVFGRASGFPVEINLASLNGKNGFRISGVAAYDYSGFSVSSAGDVNGDGFDDLIVGAWGANPNDNLSGSSYVIFGRATGTLNRTGTDARDILSGGEWDDTFHGQGGDDWIRAGAGDDIVNGGAGNDLLDGGADNDIINGGSGNDTITGSLGEDQIDGGSGTDTLSFAAFAVNRPVNIDLAAGLAVLHNGDEQTLRSIENATGGRGADTLSGNAKANALGGGNGNDVINGRAGNDTITGGNGKDILTGGAGNDRFVYTNINQSASGAAARDEITDFTVDAAAGTAFIDRIDVAAIDAVAGVAGNQAFTFIGGANFTAEGQIRAAQSGADTVVSFNTSGTTGGEMQIVLRNFTATNLTAADFIL